MEQVTRKGGDGAAGLGIIHIQIYILAHIRHVLGGWTCKEKHESSRGSALHEKTAKLFNLAHTFFFVKLLGDKAFFEDVVF